MKKKRSQSEHNRLERRATLGALLPIPDSSWINQLMYGDGSTFADGSDDFIVHFGQSLGEEFWDVSDQNGELFTGRQACRFSRESQFKLSKMGEVHYNYFWDHALDVSNTLEAKMRNQTPSELMGRGEEGFFLWEDNQSLISVHTRLSALQYNYDLAWSQLLSGVVDKSYLKAGVDGEVHKGGRRRHASLLMGFATLILQKVGADMGVPFKDSDLHEIHFGAFAGADPFCNHHAPWDALSKSEIHLLFKAYAKTQDSRCHIENPHVQACWALTFFHFASIGRFDIVSFMGDQMLVPKEGVLCVRDVSATTLEKMLVNNQGHNGWGSNDLVTVAILKRFSLYMEVMMWGASGRKVIEISQKSLQSLKNVTLDRIASRKNGARLEDLPKPGDKYFKRTIALRIEVETDSICDLEERNKIDFDAINPFDLNNNRERFHLNSQMYGQEMFDTEYDEYIPGDLWDGGSLSPSSFNFADYRQSKRGKQVHYIFVSSASLVMEPRFMAQVYSKPAKTVHHPGLTFLPYTPCATTLHCPWMATQAAPWEEKWSDTHLARFVELNDLQNRHPQGPGHGSGMVYSLILRMIALNALAALNSDVCVTDRRKRRKGKKGERGARGSRSGRASGIHTIRLDDDGMRTWSRKIILEEQTDREMRKSSKKRGTMGVHTVPGHLVSRWVISPEPHEEIFATKPRAGKKEGMLYLVKRFRSTFSRGNELITNRSRLKSGIDDLNIPKLD